MAYLLGLWAWLVANYAQVSAILLGAVALAEAIVKLTPTESDDGAVKRIGAIIDKLLSFIPGNKK